MIRLVSVETLHGDGPQLDQMCAIRSPEAIVGNPAAGGAADDHDDERAVYLMDIDDQAKLSRVIRLHPGPASGPGWRAGRWFVLEIRGDVPDPALAPLVIGLFEFCERRALSWMAIEAHAGLSRRLVSVGCPMVEGDGRMWRMQVSPDAQDAPGDASE